MRIDAAIVVPHSLADVWEFLSDPQNAVLWDRSVETIEAATKDPVGLGWEGITTAPSGMRQRFRISRWDPPRGFAFRLMESTMFREAELGFDLEQIGDDVRIVHRLDLHLRSILLYPVLRLTAKRALDTDLAALRAQLEKSCPLDGALERL